MPKAADATNGDDVAGAGPGMTERVEGGDAGAKQRRRLDRVEVVGHMLTAETRAVMWVA
jgi:hypothetical protein